MHGSMAAESIPFTKMQGCGNDYVVVDAGRNPIADPAAFARTVTDRRRGVGADGLLLALPSNRADARMRMFNPDGSEAEMCGNGLRCLARFVGDRQLVPDPVRMHIETGAGVLRVTRDTGVGAEPRITIRMGRPDLASAEEETFTLGDTNVRLTAVSMGNPHAVLFVDDVEVAPVAEVGRQIERHPAFPRRTNVEFVQVVGMGEVRQRTWERGVGETEACGTGACAVVVAGALSGRTGRDVKVHLRGGDLHVHWADDDQLHLTGPAVEVFEGHWPLK